MSHPARKLLIDKLQARLVRDLRDAVTANNMLARTVLTADEGRQLLTSAIATIVVESAAGAATLANLDAEEAWEAYVSAIVEALARGKKENVELVGALKGLVTAFTKMATPR